MTYRASLNWMIVFIVAIGLVFLPQGHSAEAASINKIVKVSSTAIKEKPYSYGKKLGILRDGAKVKVHRETKSGWSEIRYKGKKAYVLSRHLQTSYNMNPNRTYVYRDSAAKQTTAYYYLGKDGAWDTWQYYIDGGEVYTFHLAENSAGLFSFWPGDEYSFTLLPYPMKTGKKWNNPEEYGITRTITSVTKTIKTPAGTFRKVIAVKSGAYTFYYAPNVGYIMGEYRGKKFEHLVKLK